MDLFVSVRLELRKREEGEKEEEVRVVMADKEVLTDADEWKFPWEKKRNLELRTSISLLFSLKFV